MHLLFQFLPNPTDIFHNLRNRQPVLLQLLLHIVTVDKLFLHTIVQYLHIRRTVITGNLLAKATVQHSVLKSNDQCMVALQVIEQSLVHTRDVARIDKRGIHSFLFLQPGSHGFAQLIERAQSQYGDLLSTMGHLITVQRLAVILLRFYIPADNPIGRHANGNRMFRLTDATPALPYTPHDK